MLGQPGAGRALPRLSTPVRLVHERLGLNAVPAGDMRGRKQAMNFISLRMQQVADAQSNAFFMSGCQSHNFCLGSQPHMNPTMQQSFWLV